MTYSEQELTERLVDELYCTQKVWFEVPNMGQSVDLVIDIDGRLTFVEVKIKNWAKAIQQCKAHELVADYIYIAIATKNISKGLITETMRNGYGLIHYNWDKCRWELVLESCENNNIWLPQRHILNMKLKMINYAN
jgi:hypothetical protein